MRSFWLVSKIDKALKILGYDSSIIPYYTDKEKEGIIIDEYLNILTSHSEDCASFSLEEMAEFIISHRKSPVI